MFDATYIITIYPIFIRGMVNIYIINTGDTKMMKCPKPEDFDSDDDYYDALDMWEQNGIEDEDRAEAEYEKLMESREYRD